MNELEKLALRHIQSLSQKCDHLVTQAALKTHIKDEKVNAERDVYPIGMIARDIGYWAEAIIKNQDKK